MSAALFGGWAFGRMMERAGLAYRYRYMSTHAAAFDGLRIGGQVNGDTRPLRHFLGHTSITNTVRYTAMSPEPFKDTWR